MIRYRSGLVGSLLLATSYLSLACDSAPPSTAPSAPAVASSVAGPSSAPASTALPSAAQSVASSDALASSTSGSLDRLPTARGSAIAVEPTSASRGPAPEFFAKAKNGVLPDNMADSVLMQGEASKVALLEPGADPREVLRYDLPLSKTQSTTMRMAVSMKLSLDGRPAQAVEVPTIEVVLRLASGTARDARGNTPIDGTLASARIASDSDASSPAGVLLRDQIAALEGTRIRYAVSPSGRAVDVKVEPSKNTPAQASQMLGQMAQSFESMVAPLPDEAVGVGARWVVTNRVSTGADLLQWTTYTLEAREGSTIRLATEVAQLAARSSMSGGDLPPGIVAEIREFGSSGKGGSTLDLAGLVPKRGEGDIDSRVMILAGGASTTIGTRARITFEETR